MIFYHFAYTILALLLKVGVLHILQLKAASVVFLPNEYSSFIAQIKKTLIVGVVAGSYRVCVHILHQV